MKSESSSHTKDEPNDQTEEEEEEPHTISILLLIFSSFLSGVVVVVVVACCIWRCFSPPTRRPSQQHRVCVCVCVWGGERRGGIGENGRLSPVESLVVSRRVTE